MRSLLSRSRPADRPVKRFSALHATPRRLVAPGLRSRRFLLIRPVSATADATALDDHMSVRQPRAGAHRPAIAMMAMMITLDHYGAVTCVNHRPRGRRNRAQQQRAKRRSSQHGLHRMSPSCPPGGRNSRGRTETSNMTDGSSSNRFFNNQFDEQAFMTFRAAAKTKRDHRPRHRTEYKSKRRSFRF